MKQKNYLFRSSITVSSIIALALIFALLDKNISQDLRDFLRSNPRQVLGTIDGAFLGKESRVTVVKIRTAEGIALEIYDSKDQQYKLIKKIPIGSQDAFFNFAGQISNLAADDVDGDNVEEILVPLYDENLVAHLAILRYDPETNEFERL